MFSVPGKYSGGSSERYTWTQTLNEIELRAPLPAELAAGAVSCTFRARGLDASWDGAERIAGELTDNLAVDDCLWVVERDAGAVLVATMRKAAPRVWTKLFSSDPEPAEPPQLLDGLAGRSAPDATKSKEEMLREAKKRAATELNGPSQAKLHTVEGRVNETLTISASDMPQLPVVVIRQCEGCTITLAADASVIKLQVEGCKGCTLKLAGRLLTETCEVWDCAECSVRFGNKSSTVQVDSCTALSLAYAQASFFDRVMHTGPRRLTLSFDDSPQLDTTIELDELQKKHTDIELDERTDQFVTRRLDSAAEELTTELVIRLANDFPTTEREAKDFEERTRMHAEKLDEVVDGMLGTSLGRTLTEAEREQMKSMLHSQSEAASAAKQAAELTREGRHEARVEFKKKEGNEAFKGGDYQQAAVFYTEALALDDKQHALYSNRAACFLKLGRYPQAKDDAEACIRIDPKFPKGHFRLALALQALEKFGEACSSFNKVLDLEPNNKDAASGLNMARMQAERQRRAAAGLTTS